MHLNGTEMTVTVNLYDAHSVPSLVVEGYGLYGGDRIMRLSMNEIEARRIVAAVAELDRSREVHRAALAAIRLRRIQAEVAERDRIAAYRGR